MSRRSERMGEQLRAEIARILREEAADPRLRLLSLTRVDLAPDLSSARVFWSALSGAAPPAVEEIAQAFERAAGFVRTRIAHHLNWKRTPRLDFHHDASLQLGAETLAVLQEVQVRDGEA